MLLPCKLNIISLTDKNFLKNYLFRRVIICDYWWLFICVDDYMSLFVIINVFNVKKIFFVIICNHLFMHFVKKYFYYH